MPKTRNPTTTMDNAVAQKPLTPRKDSPYARTWWWIRLVLVVGMIVALVVMARPGMLWEELSSAEYLLALGAVPFVFGAAFIDALRLHLLLLPHGYRQGWWATVRTNLVVNAVSPFLPGTVGGGAVAWYRLALPDKLHAQAFTALGVNMLLKFVAISAVGAAALALDARASQAHGRYVLPLLLCAAAPLAVFFLMLYTGLTRTLKALNQRFVVTRFPRLLGNPLRKALESIETYRRQPFVVVVGLGSCVVRAAVGAMAAVLCMKAVGIEQAGLMRMLWILAASEIAGMMPFTMSFFGLPQVAFVGLLVACGIAKDQALAANILLGATLIPMLLAGALILLLEGRMPRAQA